MVDPGIASTPDFWGGCLCVVAMASGSMPDIMVMVDTWMEQECKIRKAYRDYQLLRVREKATRKEIEIIYKKMSMLLHPDKNQFANWAINRFPTITQEALVEGNNMCRAMWDKYLETKNRLAELDDAKYKKAMQQHVSTLVNLSSHGQTCCLVWMCKGTTTTCI